VTARHDGRMNGFGIRPRTDTDLDACERIVRAVHALDRYPPYLPDGNYRGVVDTPDVLAAWVAVDGEQVLGHVAVHATTMPETIELATKSLGLSAEQLGVVARLFVAPEARRRGVARTLLDHATDETRARGLVPVLDTALYLDAANALYERAGWTRLGETVVQAGGETFGIYVYAAPGAA